MDTPLDRLCTYYGVLPAYRDIWDGEHRISDTARRALLKAMHVAADSDGQVAAELLAAERRDWQHPLPPVLVLRGNQPCRVAVTLPCDEEQRILRWLLRQESGTEQGGEFVPAELERVERCRLDDREYARYLLTLEAAPEPGYHRLGIEHAQAQLAETSLIVAPATCYLPPALQGDGRVWGIAAQLYAVRSEHNWGIGDFGDLRRTLEFCAEAGASTLLLNPLHALFPGMPQHASPYSPSHRAYFNVLYLEVEGIAEFSECEEVRAEVRAPEFRARLRALRASEQVDYTGVAQAKLAVLGRLYAHFCRNHLAHGSVRAQAFRAFQAERGDSLRRLALFETLQEHFGTGWPAWPAAYRAPHARKVAAFCERHLERVEFFEYLQWQAGEQLAAAGTRSWELGLGIGMMLDLAVGVAADGAATWAQQELHANGAGVGAPPDQFNPHGQDWGLPPWIPHRLREAGYRPFIELLRANMRDAGALRVDHVMGLFRQYWVTHGLPAEGGYVRYPGADLLGILALESVRNRCMVVGEDLGTVPDEVRRDLQPLDALSTRLLYFERGEDGRLQPPQAYPRQAVVAVTTHDLPTLAGFWQGQDIELRTRLQQYPDSAARDRQVVARAEDRARLLLALDGVNLLPPGGNLQPVTFPQMTPELAAAVYGYLARTPSGLLLLGLEDGFGVREQPNLPGTEHPAYPCWRLKLPLNLEEWRDSTWLQGILLALRNERPLVQAEAKTGGAAAGAGLRAWIPRATYRLQLNRDFRLAQAAELIPYLNELGVSHCYLSPLLKARPGSMHGYDIIDHSSLNPEIASAEDFERFAAVLKQRGMGLIMDMVPNHMGVMGADNGWWLDVLENGPASRFAGYFDIDWYSVAGDQTGRVLLPVLGDHYGTVLEGGELRLTFDQERGAFSVYYYRHCFPIDPREYPRILGRHMETLQARLGEDHSALHEFQTLVTAFGHLPPRDSATPQAGAERERDKEVHKRRLAALCDGNADIAGYLDENLAEYNGAAGNFDALHDLLQAQAYRLAFWRVAADEINYRRFFDINDLAALRVENPEVFENVHRLVRELLVRGHVNGLRIDHPDGLYAPQEYFERVQAMARSLQPAASNGESRPLYLVAEKVLSGDERLPAEWPVHGSTGYDFAAACSGLFVDAAAAKHFSRIYHGFIRAQPGYEDMVRGNKHLIMDGSLAGELRVLATQLMRIARADRHTCDFTLNGLRGALAEVVASFPVYRTYVAGCEIARDDMQYVESAVAAARMHSRAADRSIFDFIRDVLLVRHGQGMADSYRTAIYAFAMKFQQYTAPVMAKAVEDTTFYQYNRLVSLNEVGSDPYRFGISLAEFHRCNEQRGKDFPHAMLAGSTHDSKRSEDVRARIGVLSELPDEWRNALGRWSKAVRGRKKAVRAPSRNDEYLLYQTLIGVWPFAPPDEAECALLARRVSDYMIKAAREAKVHSSWSNPDSAYENALCGFAGALFVPGSTFLSDFLPFHARIAHAGALTSLSQLLLRITCPGVPDIYQGNEMWDFSLVDPDNRRPVDFARLRQTLLEISALHDSRGVEACARELLADLPDGRIKLYLIWKTLTFRREHEALFDTAGYISLNASGKHAKRVCAFARCASGETLVLAVPRLVVGLIGQEGRLPVGAEVWGDTALELPPETEAGQWLNVLTGETFRIPAESGGELALAQLFATFPYALLQYTA